MNIAKIVSSNSHIDYLARVHSSFDMHGAPADSDYGFGTFVSMKTIGRDCRFIAAVYDSQLINPDYANFGPRLSPQSQLAQFSPDVIDEQGILLGLIVLGTLNDDGEADQTIPFGMIRPGTEVHSLSNEDLLRFHTEKDGKLVMRYFSQITQNAGNFAVALLDSITDQLTKLVNESDIETIKVLNDSLKWQNTFAGTKF